MDTTAERHTDEIRPYMGMKMVTELTSQPFQGYSIVEVTPSGIVRLNEAGPVCLARLPRGYLQVMLNGNGGEVTCYDLLQGRIALRYNGTEIVSFEGPFVGPEWAEFIIASTGQIEKVTIYRREQPDLITIEP